MTPLRIKLPIIYHAMKVMVVKSPILWAVQNKKIDNDKKDDNQNPNEDSDVKCYLKISSLNLISILDLQDNFNFSLNIHATEIIGDYKQRR